MTGFAISGALYDISSVTQNLKAFRAMSLILMASRLSLVVQYGVVLWYVKGYKKTFIPLASTMLVLFLAAMIFLGTFFGFHNDSNQHSFPVEHGQSNGSHTYIAW
jgi:DMSO reductase anchor subunit